MTAAEQSSEPRRDYASPATWGDVESVRHEVADLRSDVARMESGLNARITQVESGLDARVTPVESGLRGDAFEGLRLEIERMGTRLIRWVVATVAASTASIGALIGILEALR